MGQHATSRGFGSLESAVRKVLERRTKVCVFFDRQRRAGPVFQVAGSGPELTSMQSKPNRFELVGAYNREFDPDLLIEDAQEVVQHIGG